MNNQFNKAARSKTPPPYSIRFNWNERDELERLSSGLSWSAYIKGIVFGKNGAKQRILAQKIDKVILAKILGALGKSRLSSNLNQLAKAANSGSLPVNEETCKALNRACREIIWMKETLIEGMNLKCQDELHPTSTIMENSKDATER